MHEVAHSLGQLSDGQVNTGAHVDVPGPGISVHKEQTGIGQVVHVQELTPRIAGPPDTDRGIASLLRLMEPAHQGRQYVSTLHVEVVPRPVEVGRHGRDEVVAVLLPVRLAELDTGDLGEGIALVGRLQGPAQQGLLCDRLLSQPRVDARAPQVQQLLDADPVGGLHDRRVDHQVVVEELRRTTGVGVDPTDRAGHQKYVRRALRVEP